MEQENKTMVVKYKTWYALTKLKLELSHSTLDQTMDYLLYELEQDVDGRLNLIKERMKQ